MNLLKTPKLRLAQLQSFTKTVLNIAQDHTEIEVETNQVSIAFAPFNESVINIEAKSNKKVLDRLRDTLISGLV